MLSIARVQAFPRWACTQAKLSMIGYDGMVMREVVSTTNQMNINIEKLANHCWPMYEVLTTAHLSGHLSKLNRKLPDPG